MLRLRLEASINDEADKVVVLIGTTGQPDSARRVMRDARAMGAQLSIPASGAGRADRAVMA
jgi:hypothetical protein